MTRRLRGLWMAAILAAGLLVPWIPLLLSLGGDPAGPSAVSAADPRSGP